MNAALARARTADPAVEKALKDIEDRRVQCWVTEQYHQRAETKSYVEKSFFSVEIMIPGYRFANDPSGGRFEDDSCNTFDTTLVHEIFHCWNRATNNNREEGDPEAQAVRFENSFRRRIGICNRTRYGGRVIESSNCTTPDLACPVTGNRCGGLFCCAVYGGIKSDTGAWSTCLVPDVTVNACRAQTIDGETSAGERDRNVCMAPDHAPFCGGK